MQTKALTEFTETDPLYETIKQVTLMLIKYRDRGSKFDILNPELDDLADDGKIKHLKEKNYDILFGYKENDIIGVYVYQKNEDGWHMFRVQTLPGHKDGEIWNLTLRYLEHVRENCPQKRTRMSKGGHEDLIKLVNILYNRQERLNLKVDKETYWVETL